MADVKNLNPDLQDKEPQLSKEELSKRREEITEFYKDNIPHLEVQADYESLLAAIEKARAEDKLQITVDGHFGPNTEKHVERFQLAHSFPVDGIVSNTMWVLILNLQKSVPDEIDEDTDVTEQYFTTNYDQLIHKHYLPKGEYVNGPIKNEYIVLHHTAGNANPYRCIDHWGRDTRGRIATEFVLGGINHRNCDNEFDGVMVQAFPTGNQGWHLGKTGSGFMNRHSVGLEICSMGYLDNTSHNRY